MSSNYFAGSDSPYQLDRQFSRKNSRCTVILSVAFVIACIVCGIVCSILLSQYVRNVINTYNASSRAQICKHTASSIADYIKASQPLSKDLGSSPFVQFSTQTARMMSLSERVYLSFIVDKSCTTNSSMVMSNATIDFFDAGAFTLQSLMENKAYRVSSSPPRPYYMPILYELTLSASSSNETDPVQLSNSMKRYRTFPLAGMDLLSSPEALEGIMMFKDAYDRYKQPFHTSGPHLIPFKYNDTTMLLALSPIPVFEADEPSRTCSFGTSSYSSWKASIRDMNLSLGSVLVGVVDPRMILQSVDELPFYKEPMRIEFYVNQGSSLVAAYDTSSAGLHPEEAIEHSIPDLKVVIRCIPGEKVDQQLLTLTIIPPVSVSVAVLFFVLLLLAGLRHTLFYESKTEELQRLLEEVQSARVEAEKATISKSFFLAYICHEFRNPLQALVGNAELLAQSGAVRDIEGVEGLQTILDSSELLISIINDAMELQNISEGKVLLDCSSFSLRNLLTPIFNDYRRLALHKGVELRTCVDSRVPEALRGDPSRVRQLVVNLLSNAIKFTHQGYVEVHVGVCGPTDIEPSSKREGQESPPLTRKSFSRLRTPPQIKDEPPEPVRLKVTVRDTGVGIAPELYESLFVPYSRYKLTMAREHGGTGLGLAICKGLVAAMGGSITVQSEPRKGTEFVTIIELQPSRDSSPRPSAGHGQTPLLALKNRLLVRRGSRRPPESSDFKPVRTACDLAGFDSLGRPPESPATESTVSWSPRTMDEAIVRVHSAPDESDMRARPSASTELSISDSAPTALSDASLWHIPSETVKGDSSCSSSGNMTPRASSRVQAAARMLARAAAEGERADEVKVSTSLFHEDGASDYGVNSPTTPIHLRVMEEGIVTLQSMDEAASPTIPSPTRPLIIECQSPPTSPPHDMFTPPRASPTDSTRAVLLVEDEIVNQRLMKRIVGQSHLVDVANNGQEAVDFVRMNPGRYFLVLMDLNMPVMDGYTATKILRTEGFKEPIVALSASTLPEEQSMAFSMGVQEFLSKPAKRDSILALVRRYAPPPLERRIDVS